MLWKHRAGGLCCLSLVLVAACDKGDEDDSSSTGPTYSAHCRVSIESQGEEAPLRYEGRAEVQTAAEEAAWATTCAELSLPAGCRDSLPDGLRYDGIMCMRMEITGGTGLSAAGAAQYNCTVNLQDRRSIRTAESEIRRSGSRDELENYSEELCGEAIVAACAELGAEGDCTAGDGAAFSVVGQSAGRQLGGGE